MSNGLELYFSEIPEFAESCASISNGHVYVSAGDGDIGQDGTLYSYDVSPAAG